MKVKTPKRKRISQLKAVLKAAESLTPSEKRKLLNRVQVDLIRSEPPVKLLPWHIEELERRAAEYEKNPDNVLTWLEVRERIRAKYGY
jgi:putative addiction module component (TIGR02574 family)